jgi:hypothetical protein
MRTAQAHIRVSAVVRCPDLLVAVAKAAFRYVPEVCAVSDKEELLVVLRELRDTSRRQDTRKAVEAFMVRYRLNDPTR